MERSKVFALPGSDLCGEPPFSLEIWNGNPKNVTLQSTSCKSH